MLRLVISIRQRMEQSQLRARVELLRAQLQEQKRIFKQSEGEGEGWGERPESHVVVYFLSTQRVRHLLNSWRTGSQEVCVMLCDFSLSSISPSSSFLQRLF